jgi:hypothetical protein
VYVIEFLNDIILIFHYSELCSMYIYIYVYTNVIISHILRGTQRKIHHLFIWIVGFSFYTVTDNARR